MPTDRLSPSRWNKRSVDPKRDGEYLVSFPPCDCLGNLEGYELMDYSKRNGWDAGLHSRCEDGEDFTHWTTIQAHPKRDKKRKYCVHPQ